MNIQTLHTWPEGGEIDKDDPVRVTIAAAKPPKVGDKKDGSGKWTLLQYKLTDDEGGEIWGSRFVNDGEAMPDQNAMVGCSAQMTGKVHVYNGKKSINGVGLEIMGGTPYLAKGEAPPLTTSAKPKGVTDQDMVKQMTNWGSWLAHGLGCEAKDVTACVNTLAIAFLNGGITLAPLAKPDAGVDVVDPAGAGSDNAAPPINEGDIPF